MQASNSDRTRAAWQAVRQRKGDTTKAEGYCEQFGVSTVVTASGVYTNIKIITLRILNVRR